MYGKSIGSFIHSANNALITRQMYIPERLCAQILIQWFLTFLLVRAPSNRFSHPLSELTESKRSVVCRHETARRNRVYWKRQKTFSALSWEPTCRQQKSSIYIGPFSVVSKFQRVMTLLRHFHHLDENSTKSPNSGKTFSSVIYWNIDCHSTRAFTPIKITSKMASIFSPSCILVFLSEDGMVSEDGMAGQLDSIVIFVLWYFVRKLNVVWVM